MKTHASRFPFGPLGGSEIRADCRGSEMWGRILEFLGPHVEALCFPSRAHLSDTHAEGTFRGSPPCEQERLIPGRDLKQPLSWWSLGQ